MSTRSLNKLLEKEGLKSEDLREDERKQYNDWLTALSAPAVKMSDLKSFIARHLFKLEYEQDKWDNTPERDLYLKAIIRNLKMIQAFIEGPEKRKAWAEADMENKSKA